MRKVVLYIASSLDGFIAKPNDDLGFLNLVAKEGEDYGYHAFMETVDCMILGRKTYDWVVKELGFFPHQEETYVITREAKPSKDNVTFYSGDLAVLIAELKAKEGKDIFINGGAEVVHMLLKQQLIEEIIISYIPILLGGGTPLFKTPFPEQKLNLISTQSFESGLVQVSYGVEKG